MPAPPISLPVVQPLPDELSARRLLSRGQLVVLLCAGVLAVAIAAVRLAGYGPSPVWWGEAAVAVVTVAYVLVIAFKFALVLSAGKQSVLQPGTPGCPAVPDSGLPDYTVLVPLYREERVLPALIAKLSGLRYPAERLQVLLLVEQDDGPTRAALRAQDLGPQFEIVVIEPSEPRTKPKACNAGLERARGEFCVIYDAEDRPEPEQLGQAVAAFRSLPDWVVCVQAELQYWNPFTNWLTQCFAAEYALNFSLFLRGLDRFRLPIPLGGTSNHFRTEALRRLGGWDPHNVTEDADLGIRIARRGWAIRMMASVTEEEANSRVGNWLRQRSRWIKGYYQTWLVHMRSPRRLWRELGPRRFLSVQATLGMATVTTLINPLFWALTVLYLVDGPGPISALFPLPVLYLGVLAMLGGNLLMVYSLMLGCMERGLYRALRAQLAVPLYWALMSAAAYKALYQLLNPRRRHFWELTEHGLIDEHESTGAAPAPEREMEPEPVPAAAASTRVRRRLPRGKLRIPGITASVLLLVAAVSATLAWPHAGARPAGRDAALAGQPAPDGSDGPASAATVRLVADWVSQQVSRSVTVACDPRMCAALQARGVPAANLLVLGAATPGPLGAEVVVATPAVRSEFGRRLQNFYAPAVLAGFGTGPGQVTVRVTAPAGVAAYDRALRQDEAARTAAGTELLANQRITVAPRARAQLAAGDVDSRLLIMLPVIAAVHPVRVLDFGDPGPGASPGTPLTSADLSGSGQAAGMTDAGYASWLAGFDRAQLAPFAGRTTVLRPGGQPVVRLQVSRPGPLDLLAAR
jgi:cellulose synthase/poly-beta-1,6-N-acetylglucosamine synthase-like glycosyltransferase